MESEIELTCCDCRHKFEYQAGRNWDKCPKCGSRCTKCHAMTVAVTDADISPNTEPNLSSMT